MHIDMGTQPQGALKQGLSSLERNGVDGFAGVDENETWGGRITRIVLDVAGRVQARRVDVIGKPYEYFWFMGEMWKLAVEVFERSDERFTTFRTVETTETHDVVRCRFNFDKYREMLVRVANERFGDAGVQN